MTNKGFKFEIFPSEEQRERIWKTIGCNRLVWNLCLEKCVSDYQSNGKYNSAFDLDKQVTKWKNSKKYSFLSEVDSKSFQITTDNLCKAFRRLSKGVSKFPRRHTKYSGKQSYTTSFTNTTSGGNIKVSYKEGCIQLPILKKIKSSLSRKFIGNIKRATVSFEGNRYWVSFQVEVKETKALPKTTQCCGIDLGIKDFATIYSLEKVDGKHCSKVENPKHLKKSQERIKFLQKNLSRKKKGSNNYVKAKKKLNKKHTKVRNQRKDFLHKLSRSIVDENQVICIEDLQVKRMLESAPSKVRDSFSDVGWRMFRTMLEYKCNWYGRQLVVVPTNYPSSQLCWKCHHKNPEVKDLTVRKWTCPHCGCKHDRDKNASKNILTEGLRILNEQDTAA